jgi:hypothetical protein
LSPEYQYRYGTFDYRRNDILVRLGERQYSTDMTHTYASLEVTPAVYDEIKDKLTKAGYHHSFLSNGIIDMHGIGLERGEAVDPEPIGEESTK